MSSPAHHVVPPTSNSRAIRMGVPLTGLGIIASASMFVVGGWDYLVQAGLPVGLALVLAAWAKSAEARKILVQDVGGAVLLFTVLLVLSGGDLLTGPFAAADAARTGNLGSFLENLALLLSLFAWLGVCRALLFEVFKRWLEPAPTSN